MRRALAVLLFVAMTGCGEADLFVIHDDSQLDEESALKRCRRGDCAPTVSISAPAHGAEVKGTVAISGAASDDRQLQRVEVRIDSGAFALASGTSSWTTTWNSASVADGAHTITVRALDSAGQLAQASITVNVANAVVVAPADTTAPSLSIATPSEGAIVSGSVGVSGSASDASGVAQVQYQLDSGPLTTASGTSAWSFSFDSRGLADGAHALTVIAHDARGNSGRATRTFVVENSASPGDTTQPLASLTITRGTRVSGTYALTGSAYDGSGVPVSIRLELDGRLVHTQSATGYLSFSFPWETSGAFDGEHLVRLVAVDAAGNWRWREATVVVDNVPDATATPPTASLDPLPAGTISGLLSLQGSFSAPAGVSLVSVVVDGEPLPTTTGSGRFSASLDTRALTNASHRVWISVRDHSGLIARHAQTIQTLNYDPAAATPQIQLLNLQDGDRVAGSGWIHLAVRSDSPVSVTMTDALGRTLINNGQLSTGSLPEGPTVVQIRAVDAQGDTATRALQLVVDNLPDPGPADAAPATTGTWVSPEGTTITVDPDVTLYSIRDVYRHLLDVARDLDEVGPRLRIQITSSGGATCTTSCSDSGCSGSIRMAAPAGGTTGYGSTPWRTMAHEYGHVWMNAALHRHGDRTYVEARGLDGDPSLDASYAWATSELAAQDWLTLKAGGKGRFVGSGAMTNAVPYPALSPGLVALMGSGAFGP